LSREAATSTSSELVAASATAQTSTVHDSRNTFRFLNLPPELRLMVYRHLLRAKRRIHLDRFLPKKHWKKTAGHHPDFCTTVLRICRQISFEALPVLYGENKFSVVAVGSYPTVIQRYFSETNRLRLRKLIIIHPCWDYFVESDDPESNDYNLIDELFEEYGPQLENELYGEAEIRLLPMPVALNPTTWRPIFANLTSLTIRVTLNCWYYRPEDVDDSEVITHVSRQARE
jgi:hypothetical protein